MNERENYKLPKQWLPIKFEDDGYTSFLDFSNLNADQEPPVILGIYNGEEYIKVEVMAQDLGDFLLQLVQEALEDQ